MKWHASAEQFPSSHKPVAISDSVLDHDLPEFMLDPKEMALDTVLSTGDYISEAMGMTHELPPVESFQHNRPDVVLAADEVVPGAVGMTHELPDLEPTEQDRREFGMDAGEIVPETVVVPRPVGRVLELPLLETFELNQPEEETMPDSIVIAEEVVAVVPAPAVEFIQVCYPCPSPSVILGAKFSLLLIIIFCSSWVTK
jgi:hypothetical protein